MPSDFPKVAILSAESQFYLAPAIDLGIDLSICEPSDVKAYEDFSVISELRVEANISGMRNLEVTGTLFRPSSLTLTKNLKYPFASLSPIENSREFCVAVARSPHDQASVWSPVEIFRRDDASRMWVVSPGNLGNARIATMQNLAMKHAREIDLVGVGTAHFGENEGEISLCAFDASPQSSGIWTIAGSRTNQYEQHLRAILDLPLGDPSMLHHCVVTGDFHEAITRDMYRPYLHLMARDPKMKFHRNVQGRGFVTSMGGDLLDLVNNAEHALDYLNGVIDE